MLALGVLEWVLVLSLTTLLVIGLKIILETEAERSHKRVTSLLKSYKRDVKSLDNQGNVFQRIYGMIEDKVIKTVDKQRKSGRLSSLDIKLQQAGSKHTTNQVWARSFIFCIAGSFLGVALGKVPLIFAFAGVGAYYPFFSLKNAIDRRQFILLNQLPDFLDLVAITFPACSSVEETFEIVSTKYDNEVSEEFTITVKEIKLGKRKRDAYDDLSLRTGLPEIATLVSQINQAENFGTGLQDVLTAQSKTIRHAKKIAAEKKGNQAKLLIYGPAILLLLISIGIIMFPFAATTLDNFSDMF